MNGHTLLQSLTGVDASVCQAPAQADVLVLQSLSRDQLQARARQFLTLFREQDGCARDDVGARQEHADQTVMLLPDGARAILYHASGALRYVSGLALADAAFERDVGRDTLVRLMEERARTLSLPDWAGAGNQLGFE